MTKQNSYIFTGNKATERYNNNKFVTLKRSFNDTTETFSKTSASFKDIKSLIKTYNLDRQYRPEYHVHNYSNGKCTTCGDNLNDYSNGGFPAVFGNTCPNQGKITKVTYKNVNFLVYTPYGYKKTNKYNVLFLIHGKNGDQNDWLVYEQASEGLSKTTGKNLFDWAIYRGNVAPFIAVSVQYIGYWDGDSVQEKTYQILSKNIKETVLPYIVENYGTYAKGSSENQLVAARKHFAIAGLSLGANAVERIGFMKNRYYTPQYYGTKIVLSGYVYGNYVCQCYKESGYTSDSIYFIDGGKYSDERAYNNMAMWKDQDTPAGTTFYRLSYNSGHKWPTWNRGIMYALQTMWR